MGTRAVRSDILYHGLPWVQYQTILIEDRKIPPDSPGVDFSGFIFLNLFPEIFFALDTETPYIFSFEMFCQGIDVGVKVIPGSFPGSPPPTICHPEKERFWQSFRMFHRIHITAYFHDPFFMLIAMKGVIKIG